MFKKLGFEVLIIFDNFSLILGRFIAFRNPSKCSNGIIGQISFRTNSDSHLYGCGCPRIGYPTRKYIKIILIIQIPKVDLVVCHNVPRSPKTYVHRVGRSARAGRFGTAVTFVTQYDVLLLKAIEV
jgi:hypothetical protein